MLSEERNGKYGNAKKSEGIHETFKKVGWQEYLNIRARSY